MEYSRAAVGSRYDYQSANTQPSDISAAEFACQHPRGDQKPGNEQHSKQKRCAAQGHQLDDGRIERGKDGIRVLRSMLKIKVGTERRMNSDKSLQRVYLRVVIQPPVSMHDEPNDGQHERQCRCAQQAMEGPRGQIDRVRALTAVSYTHLTLPTIYSV